MLDTDFSGGMDRPSGEAIMSIFLLPFLIGPYLGTYLFFLGLTPVPKGPDL